MVVGELRIEYMCSKYFGVMHVPVMYRSQNTFDQIDAHGGQYNYYKRKGPNTVNKIKDAINFMRNQQFEVEIITSLYTSQKYMK